MNNRVSQGGHVANALGISTASLNRYARLGLIPFDPTPGGHRRYDVEEVRAAIRGIRAASEGRHEYDLQVGARIAAARVNAGLAQDELARALGCTQASLSFWESGRRGVHADRLAAVARVTGCDPGWLLSGTPRGDESRTDG